MTLAELKVAATLGLFGVTGVLAEVGAQALENLSISVLAILILIHHLIASETELQRQLHKGILFQLVLLLSILIFYRVTITFPCDLVNPEGRTCFLGKEVQRSRLEGREHITSWHEGVCSRGSQRPVSLY